MLRYILELIKIVNLPVYVFFLNTTQAFESVFL